MSIRTNRNIVIPILTALLIAVVATAVIWPLLTVAEESGETVTLISGSNLEFTDLQRGSLP